MKIRIIGLQFVFFLKDVVDRPDVEFSDLNSTMLNIFDAMPQIIPIPRELPPEVPVMILRSEDFSYSCNISRSRIDFVFSRLNDDKSNFDILKDYNAKVAGLIKYILARQTVIRFGMVARYFCRDNSAVRTIRNKYFTPAVDGAEELGLRYNKKSSAFGFDINDILELSAVEMQVNGLLEKGVYIQRDINNSPVPGKSLDFDSLSKLSQKYSVRIAESEIEGLVK